MMVNNPPHILIVEDETNIRFFLEHLLQREGYLVSSVSTGEKAIQTVSEQPFVLVLLDLNLGKGLSGIEVLEKIREQSTETGVIVLTGYGSLETAVAALRKGAHDYLLKPCRADEIRNSVRRYLEKWSQEQSHRDRLGRLEQNLLQTLDEIRAVTAPAGTEQSRPEHPLDPKERLLQRGSLTIDRSRHTVVFGEQELILSPMEFDLLAYLVREAPRVVTSQEIVDQMQSYKGATWDADGAVRSHIFRLRRKLESVSGRKEVIQTVRGVGYAINDEQVG